MSAGRFRTKPKKLSGQTYLFYSEAMCSGGIPVSLAYLPSQGEFVHFTHISDQPDQDYDGPIKRKYGPKLVAACDRYITVRHGETWTSERHWEIQRMIFPQLSEQDFNDLKEALPRFQMQAQAMKKKQRSCNL